MSARVPLLLLILITGCDASSDKTPREIQSDVAASKKTFTLEREHQLSLHIQVSHIQRILFNKLPARLYMIAH